jgi:hypothetical protein
MPFELNPAKFVRRTREVTHVAELLPEVQQFLRAVTREEMKPGQQGQIVFSPESIKKMNVKYPIRTITDYLRKQLRESGHGKDYYLRKSEKLSLIDVHFLPPEVEHTTKKQPRR